LDQVGFGTGARFGRLGDASGEGFGALAREHEEQPAVRHQQVRISHGRGDGIGHLMHLMTSPRSVDSAHSTTKVELILARTEHGFQVPEFEESR
jgi:hypothetical protein